MAWAFVRPADPSVLAGRPLLDVGTGDAQTVLAITSGGLRVGIDRSVQALGAARRSGLTAAACAVADALPFDPDAFRTVLAGDVFHHTGDELLRVVLDEIKRVLAPDGRLVAWWYTQAGRGGVDDPRYPRSYEDVAALVTGAGFATVRPLDLRLALEPSPPTVGLLAG